MPKKDKTMWFITAVRYSKKKNKIERRCWGFFKKLKQARKAVLANEGDMFECYYQYIILEEFCEGSSTFCMSPPYWFIWDDERAAYKPTSEPHFAHKKSYWGLG